MQHHIPHTRSHATICLFSYGAVAQPKDLAKESFVVDYKEPRGETHNVTDSKRSLGLQGALLPHCYTRKAGNSSARIKWQRSLAKGYVKATHLIKSTVTLLTLLHSPVQWAHSTSEN